MTPQEKLICELNRIHEQHRKNSRRIELEGRLIFFGIILLGLIAVFCGCTTLNEIERGISPQGMTLKEVNTPELFGKSLSDINKDPRWKVTEVGIVKAPRWEKDDGKPYHYALKRIDSKGGKSYFLQHTYLDDEDGGNSFGWVLDEDKKKIGLITDSDISGL